jgi:hypothetical protein
MTTATRTEAQPPALHVADSHELIRVHGARGERLSYDEIMAASGAKAKRSGIEIATFEVE